MIQTLINSNQYDGKFVAIEDLKDNVSIVGQGTTPEEALSQAQKRGVNNPTITFVPIEGLVQIY